ILDISSVNVNASNDNRRLSKRSSSILDPSTRSLRTPANPYSAGIVSESPYIIEPTTVLTWTVFTKPPIILAK
ncbi:hypothetical protein BDR03DRAFT_974467, partial [Suillus americanus]